MIHFAPLFEKLKKENKSQFFLIKNGVDSRIMDRLRHNRNVETKTLSKICRILNCRLDEIAEYAPDKE